ncbi:unnamed protein product [Kuraishia capsulata CBS 1993]|uniref:N-acetylglucosamine-induced protein 1 n=1 Tax=Kuraishia capsulata CBS 1993 TaxID=1382522 RepID=W6MN63_9ASCO|nr:uncharacterized protein KUCA_T00004055001 [Kuraishia capsulata CBS 1993]CDK28074.1 unnamed protein product [Kuraishia capsulata CBS 1993]
MATSETPMTWEVLKEVLQTNDIAKLYRSPESLEKYRRRKQQLAEANVSVHYNLLVNQLHWAEPSPGGELKGVKLDVKATDPRLFANEDDILILENEFPYNFEKGMKHLVVWTKNFIEPDPHSALGDISPETRSIIGLYVKKTFVDWLGYPQENILWFRNWSALQSVKSIAHIHVVIKDFDESDLEKIVGTGGQPLNYEEDFTSPRL